MRHRKSGRKLNRESSHRLAMFKNMSISLLEHEMIRTTLPKAKELRRYIEPLITLSKVDSVANRRLAYSRLGDTLAVKRLFEQMGPRYQARPGGYLRLLKCGFRKGDAAPMAFVQLVDRQQDDASMADVETDQEKTKPAKGKTKEAPKTAELNKEKTVSAAADTVDAQVKKSPKTAATKQASADAKPAEKKAPAPKAAAKSTPAKADESTKPKEK